MNKSLLEQPIISIVIPLYREGSILKTVLSSIQRNLESLNEVYELILVDDGSPDNTWAVIEEEAKNYPMLRAVRLSRNFGKEAALCAGLDMARGSAVIIIDGDLQHPPELIPEMVRLWKEEKFQVVEGVKAHRGKEPFGYRFGAKFFYWITDHLTGFPLHSSSDYKLLDRTVVEALKTMEERSRLFRGMVPWLGFSHATLPFSVAKRLNGTSHWSKRKLLRLAVNTITSFSFLPLHLVTIIGVFTFGFSLFIGISTLYVKWTGKAVSGFTTVILLLLLLNGVLMISLGIIGEYMARIYEEVKRRPLYILEKRLESDRS